jgi:hypothetical protein
MSHLNCVETEVYNVNQMSNSKCHPMSLLCLPKIDVRFLKLSLNQNSIVIYNKSNDDFKSHINFGKDTEDIR